MGKKRRATKAAHRTQPDPKPVKKQSARYSAGEIAMAVLGAALLIMVAGIIITSLLE